MAAPLEFKRRVRLPETLDEVRPVRRRSFAAPLGVLSWTATVALAVAIAEGVIPIERWLPAVAHAPLAAQPALARARPSRPPEPPAPRPLPAQPPSVVAADEPEPLPAPEPSAEPPMVALVADTGTTEAEPAGDPPAPAPVDERSRPEPPSSPSEPDDTPAAPKHEAPTAAATSGKSCEQAAAEAVQSIEIGRANGPADLDRSAYSAVLDRGSYFAHCGAPESVRIHICAAVQNGAAVGVTVRTTPGMSAVASCIARAVRGLSFPRHPRLDVVTTTFD